MGRHPDPDWKRLTARDVYLRRGAIPILAGVAVSKVDRWIASGQLEAAHQVRYVVGAGAAIKLYRLDDVLQLKNGKR